MPLAWKIVLMKSSDHVVSADVLRAAAAAFQVEYRQEVAGLHVHARVVQVVLRVVGGGVDIGVGEVIRPGQHAGGRRSRNPTPMAQVTPLEMYYRFVSIIDQAADAKNIYAVPEAAEAAGMVGGEEFGQ